jgi:diguanylate cyclase (GGDEF)-like protein/PAS domain S-box-containing protein
MGDEIALLSIAPVLLIYVLPWVKNQIYGVTSAITIQGDEVKKGSEPAELFLQTLEFAGQAACFLLLFWVMFGAFASNQFYFLAFLPIAWIAMRHGMRGAVIGLFALNFGIVVSLRIWPAPSDIFTKLGFVMLAVSATGLFLGTVVAERLGLANNLKEQTVFLNSLIDNSPFAIVVYDREGNIQHCSEGFTRLFLHARAEILGRNLRALVVPGEQRSEAEHFLAEANEGRTVHGNVRRLRKDGQLVDVELYILPTILDGHVQGASVVYMDISERVRAAEAAKEHEETTNRWVSELQERTMQITLLNEMSSLLQCSEDSEEAYRVVAQSARKLFGSARAGALFLLNPTHNSLERKAAWGEITAQKLEFGASDCWSLRKGHLHWSEAPGNSIVCAHTDASLAANYLCVPMVANGETLGVLHLQYDPAGANVDAETELKSRTELERLAVAAGAQVALSLTNLHLRETLREQSIRDPLTGLFNRRFMQEFLERELLASKRKGRPLAIVFVDLDHFKHFNDVFGHDAGDTVLQSMASAFRLLFRGEDVICRYGGEEFAIILPECPIQDAVKRAEALRVAVKEINLAHQGKRLDSVTLSIGVAAYPEHGEGVQELLDRADKCLYQSKANGRDCVTAASV